MFQRIRGTLKKERQLVADTKAKTEDEVYKEIADWNDRRLETEARGETFTEPIPGSDRSKRKKRRFIFFSDLSGISFSIARVVYSTPESRRIRFWRKL